MSERRYNRAALGTVTVVDILWRFPVRLLGALPDWIAPLLSVSASVGTSSLVAQSTTWALFAVSFFVFADVIYPAGADLPVTDNRFRLLVAFSGVAMGLGFGFADGLRELLPTMFSLTLLSGCLFFVYFYSVLGWPVWSAESPLLGPLQVVDESVADEYEKDLAADTRVSTISNVFVPIAAVGLVVVPCILLGVVSRILIRAYPVADLVILAILVGKSNDVGRVPGVRVVVPATQTFDLEARLHRGIETATRNIKGMFLTIYAFLGAFLGAGTLGIAVIGINRVVVEPGLLDTAREFVTNPLGGWVIGGAVVVLIVAGVHGLWVWLREFRRLTAYTAFWDNNIAVAEDIEPSRPVGMTLPTTLLMGILGLYVATEAHRAFAVAWPTGVIVTLGCIMATRWQTSSSISNEDHIVVTAFLVHGISLPALVMGEELVRLTTTGAIPLGVVLDSPALVIGIMLVGLPYFSDVERYADQFDDGRQVLEGVYLASIGVLVQLVALPASATIRLLGTVVLAVTVAFAIVGVAVDLFEARQSEMEDTGE